MRTKVAIYARVSSVEQSKGYSLDTQIEGCRAYAEDKGWSVVAELSDHETGAKMDRPGLDKLRDLATEGQIGAILVYEIDRLARKMAYQVLLELEFEKLGISVHYVRGGFDDSDEGKLQRQIRAAIAEFERAKIRERAVRGKRGKARAGNTILGGGNMLGYRIVREPHREWLEVDEEEAAVVRQIFVWYCRGDGENGPMSMGAIARKLTALRILTKGDREGHPPKKNGPGRWSLSTVADILDNTAYIGTWYYNRTRRVGRKRVPRPREEWIPVQVPPLIDHDLWETAQQRKVKNAQRAKRNKRWNYLLSSHLTCGQCGYSVHGKMQVVQQGGSKYNGYYRCGGTKDEGPGQKCRLPYFRLEDVEAAVWGWVEQILLHPDQLAKGLRERQAEAEEANKTLYERLLLVESQIKNQGQKLEKLLDLYLNSEDFPKELLADKKAALEKVLDDLEEERAKLTAHLEDSGISEAQIEDIEAFCTLIGDGLSEVTFEDKRRILDLLNVHGFLSVEDGEKVIHLRCEIDSTCMSIESSASGISALEGRQRPCCRLERRKKRWEWC